MPEQGNPTKEGRTRERTVWLLCQDKVTRRKGATDISTTRDRDIHNPSTPDTPHRARRNFRMLLQGIESRTCATDLIIPTLRVGMQPLTLRVQ